GTRELVYPGRLAPVLARQHGVLDALPDRGADSQQIQDEKTEQEKHERHRGPAGCAARRKRYVASTVSWWGVRASVFCAGIRRGPARQAPIMVGSTSSHGGTGCATTTGRAGYRLVELSGAAESGSERPSPAVSHLCRRQRSFPSRGERT